MKKKIVHITSTHRADDIRIYHKEVKTLLQHGYDVVVLCPYIENVVSDVKQYIEFLDKTQSRLYRFTIFQIKLLYKFLKYKADLYHFHDPDLMLVAKVLSLFGKNVIFDMHENLPLAIHSKKWVPFFLKGILSKISIILEWICLKKLPVIFAEQSYVKNHRYIKKSMIVLNMPLIENLLSIDVVKSKIPMVAYLGGISRERGCDLIFNALKLLLNKGVEIKYRCIGRIVNDYENDFYCQSATFGDNVIEYIPHIEPQKAWALVGECHVGMSVLLDEPNYYESYPTKMFEYMALGLPVIVSNFPLLKEVVERNQCGVCLDPSHPDLIADSILYIINHPEETKKMGENGRRAVVEKYNWGNEAKKLLQLYDEILSIK